MGETSTVKKCEYTAKELAEMDTQELLALYKETGDESIKWTVALRCEKLIKNIAMQLRGVYSSFTQIDDIVNECLLTVFEAIERYNLSRECKFETYVSKRIRGKIIDLTRKQEWFPRYFYRRSKDVERAVDELTSELGHSPSEDQIIERLGITKVQYSNYVECIARAKVLDLNDMLDKEIVSGGGVYPSNLQEQPEMALQENEMRLALAQGIASLQKNEQIVLSLYYEKNLKLREIGQVMNLSQPRISQIHSRAVQKLQDYMKSYLNGEIQVKD